MSALLAARAQEKGKPGANRIFYLSIPPSIFTAVAGAASKAASAPQGWTRVIVEKPFGRDSESFAQLEAELSTFLSEEQMYRIDHYLGKELIENLTVRGGGPLPSRAVCGENDMQPLTGACMCCSLRLAPHATLLVHICPLAAPVRT